MPQHPVPRLELSVPRVLGGALAAASAAVASSWLGVAGTVFGAVVVSVVATVGTALYAHPIERSQYAIKETLPALSTRTRQQRGAEDGPETLELSLAAAAPLRRPISWPTVMVSCVATLVLGLGMLTGFEAVMGKSASELTGSGSGGDTTLGQLVEGPDPSSGGGSSEQPSSPRESGETPTTPATTSPRSTNPPTTEPTSPTTTGPTSTEPTNTEPTNTEPTNTEPTNTEPTSTEPTSTDRPPDDEGAVFSRA